MTPHISLLMPTRARVDLANRLFQSLIDQTEDLDSIELVLYIDEDDIQSHSLHHKQLKITKIIGPRTTMGACNTSCLKLAKGNIIMLINDDMVVQTKHWDRYVLELDRSIPDKIYLAHPNDLYMGKRLSIIPILSRKTCTLLTSPYPEQYPGGFIDYHLFDIFKRLGLKGHDRIYFLENVIFEHLHHRMGKSQFDATYQRRGRADLGDEVFISLRFLRQAEAEQLSSTIENKPLTKTDQTQYDAIKIDSYFYTFIIFIKAFLMDNNLPLGWRLYLFAVFVKRHISRKFQAIFSRNSGHTEKSE